MADLDRLSLTPEQETLLVPLYCKALRDNRVLFDEKAEYILGHIDYDFTWLRIPRKTCIMLALRANQFDAYTRSFLAEHPKSVAVHLGCGLDGRFDRVDNGEVEWYDVDMPAVIDLRKKFYEETARYRMVSCSAADLTWVNGISPVGTGVLVIAEGLFMYLEEVQVKQLIGALKRAFAGCHLIFDAYSKVMAKRAKSHPSIRTIGAKVRWGIDDPKEIERWVPGAYLVEERYFSQLEGVGKLGWNYRLAFRLTNLIAAARRAHRILYYILQGPMEEG